MNTIYGRILTCTHDFATYLKLFYKRLEPFGNYLLLLR